MAKADISVTIIGNESDEHGSGPLHVSLEHRSGPVAFFVRLNVVDGKGNDILPQWWSDNYVTLLPMERLSLSLKYDGKGSRFSVGQVLRVTGGNLSPQELSL